MGGAHWAHGPMGPLYYILYYIILYYIILLYYITIYINIILFSAQSMDPVIPPTHTRLYPSHRCAAISAQAVELSNLGRRGNFSQL